MNAYDMVMRREVRIVSGAVIEWRYPAGLSNTAQSLERAMDRGKRNVRMPFTDLHEHFFGARMRFRRQQDFDNRQALRGDRKASSTASSGKFREPLAGRMLVALSNYLQIHLGCELLSSNDDAGQPPAPRVRLPTNRGLAFCR